MTPPQIGVVPLQEGDMLEHQDWDMSLVARHVPLAAELAVKIAIQATCFPQTLKKPRR
jgi:hypothetical protein